MNHQCTLSDLEKQKVQNLKNSFLPKPPKEEKIAKSNDFIFDRKNLKIIKKGQMDLL